VFALLLFFTVKATTSSGVEISAPIPRPPAPVAHNNFATIRTTTIMTRQQRFHELDKMRDQVSGYKQLRRQHQKVYRQVGYCHANFVFIG
jgi:hypothetical protein